MRLKRILKWTFAAILLALLMWLFVAYWTSTNDCNARVHGELMKAIKYCEYGPPDVLKIAEVEKPLPKDDELLISVRAASLNFIDAGLVRGPWVLRFLVG